MIYTINLQYRADCIKLYSALCRFATLSGESSAKPSDVELVPTSEVRKLEAARQMFAEHNPLLS